MKRGRPKKPVTIPELGEVPEHIKSAWDSQKNPVKTGKRKGWAAGLDYDYSGCDSVTDVLMGSFQTHIKRIQQEKLRETQVKHVGGRGSANQIRKSEKEKHMEYIRDKYKKIIETEKYSNLDRAKKILQAEQECLGPLKNCPEDTLRKCVAQIRK